MIAFAVRSALPRIAERQAGRFAPFLSVCFAAGVLLYFALPMEPSGWSGAILVALAGIGWAICRTRWIARAAMTMILACVMGFGAAQLSVWRALPLAAMPYGAVFVVGVVKSVDILPQGRRVSIDRARLNGAKPLSRFVRIRLQSQEAAFPQSGDAITVRAMIRTPPAASVPGGGNPLRDAFFSGLAGSGWAIGPVSIASASDAPSWRVRLAQWWLARREAIARRFIAAMPQPEGAMAATLFSGDQTAIPPDDRAAFSDSGLAHLLAVAGLHIAIVMGCGYAVARFGLALSEHAALRWPCKQLAAVAGLATGLFYLLLTGAHVPIVRSFSMAALVVLAIVTGRRALSVRGLGLAAILILTIWPQAILSVSFQMSFAAVLALIEGHRAAQPWMRKLRQYPGGRWIAHGAGLALTSLLAGVASMPFAAAHFGHATAYFVPANLMAVPITALLIMPSGLLAVFLMQVHLEWLAMPFLRCGLHWIVVIAHTVAAWPGSIMAVPPVSGWALACIGFSMAWIGIWRGGLRWLCAPLLVGGLLAPWFATPPDLLISADFKLIGLMRTRDLLIEQQPHASAFTLDAWRQYWGRRSVTTLPPVGQGELFRCDAAGCRLGLPDWQALLLRRDGTPDCGAIAVVISENSRVSCPGTLQIGPHSAHFNGAIAIWLDRRRRRVDVLETGNGDRPWNRSLPLSNPLPDLPMAQSE